MIYSITGELVYADPNMAAVDVNGIAFQCDISLNTFQRLGSTGSTVTLYTYMNFKQDGVDLLGFYDRSEKDAFQMLTGVSGVGPKAALAILSEMDPAKLTLAIAAGDYKAITRAKGVGPKAAQRIVLELKDKVAKNLEGGTASDTFVAATTATATATGEAIVVHVVCRENHRIELILLKAVHATLHGIQIVDIVGRLLRRTSVTQIDI